MQKVYNVFNFSLQINLETLPNWEEKQMFKE